MLRIFNNKINNSVYQLKVKFTHCDLSGSIFGLVECCLMKNNFGLWHGQMMFACTYIFLNIINVHPKSVDKLQCINVTTVEVSIIVLLIYNVIVYIYELNYISCNFVAKTYIFDLMA